MFLSIRPCTGPGRDWRGGRAALLGRECRGTVTQQPSYCRLHFPTFRARAIRVGSHSRGPLEHTKERDARAESACARDDVHGLTGTTQKPFRPSQTRMVEVRRQPDADDSTKCAAQDRWVDADFRGEFVHMWWRLVPESLRQISIGSTAIEKRRLLAHQRT